MKRKLPGLLVLVFAAGCGASATPRESPLQRFNQMSPSLSRVARNSSALYVDVRRLNRDLDLENLGAIRRQAVRTAQHARALERDAGGAQFVLQDLRRGELPSRVGVFFGFEGRALTAQWWEAFYLMRLCRLLQRDPLATIPGDATLVRQLSSAASRSAKAARSWAARGSVWKARYPLALRYTPVGTPTHK